MGPDCYQVEILHYLNPHLIWIGVLKNTEDDFVFEQVGIYGVLPVNTTLDIDGTLKTERCGDWVPAASAVMRELLTRAAEVWFCPTYIDRRSSIFDDNIHKYGELIIKASNGTEKSLTSTLKESGFALYDECVFHQSLTLSKFKTKLNNDETQDVVKQIEDYYIKKETSNKQWEKSVKKQMTVYYAGKNLETLTKRNLELHNREIMAHTLEGKIKDLNMCKEADELSVGRAISRKEMKNKSVMTSSLLKKKLDLERKSMGQNPLEVLLATKKYLDANSIKRDTSSDTLSNCRAASYDLKSNTSQVLESNIGSSVDDDVILSDQQIQKDFVKITQPASPPNKENFKSSLEHLTYPIDDIPHVTTEKRKARKPYSSVKAPEFDIHNEKLIAYGPPDLDPMKLALKIVPKDVLMSEEMEPKTNIQESVERTQCDDFVEMRSEVNFKITNVLENEIEAGDCVVPKRSSDCYISDVGNVQNDNVSKVILSNHSSITSAEKSPQTGNRLSSSLLQRKLKLHKVLKRDLDTSSSSETTNKDSSVDEYKAVAIDTAKKVDLDSDDDSIYDGIEQLDRNKVKAVETETVSKIKHVVENNVNPFKNLDGSKSVFVDKLVSPILMVHTKNNNRIQPRSNLRDVPFGPDIHIVLQNMLIKEPTRLQTVSWYCILRGHSVFMISPSGSGKTMGYLPAVCRLVSDSVKYSSDRGGPTCIILCSTAKSVADVEKLCKMFLGIDERVFACYPGVDELIITTSLLNGCDVLVCTPPVLKRLLQADFGVDLRRLATLVLEDCERAAQVYEGEIKTILHHVKEMLKNRADKKFQVQYVVASRNWCNFMEVLSKKAPDSVVCMGSFQECVIYSKTKTTVNFVIKENKVKSVVEFLKEIDGTKRVVIVCRHDAEVELLEKTLTKLKYIVFAVNNKMTVTDLYNMNVIWGDYQEPLLGPILICCDGNLTHLNVTNANYLVHFSMPDLFSSFCKRFSVLIDNLPSIFRQENLDVRVKILLEETNVEQLPKILHFVKRCAKDVPPALDEIAERVLEKKDVVKAEKLVPICSNLLALGRCPDFWNCQERHAVVKEYDEPKEWVPRNGLITFRILHYHSAVQYSVRLLSNVTNGKTNKYPQTYSTLSLKMGMHYSKENNRKLHGIPKVGDECAVSIKQNFFARCQVIKILSYQKGFPHNLLINLVDQERFEVTRDVHLYHLPDELRNVETHVVQVRLANVQPRDTDITFSDLASEQLKKITDNDDSLFVRGQITLTIGNCVFVDSLELCQDLFAFSETVVKHNLKRELLDAHAQANLDHITKLEKLCKDGNLYTGVDKKHQTEAAHIAKPLIVLPEPRWAHLETDDLSCVIFATALSPGKFFVRLLKFNKCVNLLISDIKKYVVDNPQPVSYVAKGDIVLAEFPDDCTYERARIEEILDENKVRCFFVDQGDWREIAIKHLRAITETFITQIPFQAIECRLIGVKPAGENWTEFSTNWLCDNCEDNNGKTKPLYVKHFTKDKAECTGGHNYGVTLIDTNTEKDIVINKLMIDLNLARENEDEIHYLSEFANFTETPSSSVVDKNVCDIASESLNNDKCVPNTESTGETPQVPVKDIFRKIPIRSAPLVDSENFDQDFDDRWDLNVDDTLKSMIGPIIAQYAASKGVNVDNLKNAFSAPRQSLVSIKDKPVNVPKYVPTKKEALDSDDLSSSDITQLSEKIDEPPPVTPTIILDQKRTPKLLWRQTNTTVSIKIQLIGADDYTLEMKERHLEFSVNLNETDYGFEFELYGVVDIKKSRHSNKGQYILVSLHKVLQRNWLSLTKDCTVKKWIVHDFDSIDMSSDEENVVDDSVLKAIKVMHEKADTDSDDDEFTDDAAFSYKRAD